MYTIPGFTDPDGNWNEPVTETRIRNRIQILVQGCYEKQHDIGCEFHECGCHHANDSKFLYVKMYKTKSLEISLLLDETLPPGKVLEINEYELSRLHNKYKYASVNVILAIVI